MKEIITRIKSRLDISGKASQGDRGWLNGHLLVAMPGMADPRFSRAVIFICSHNASGAMGLVVNRLFGEADFHMLLDQLNVESSSETPELEVQFGGPVEMGRGFVLHSDDYLREGTTRVTDGIAVTATIEILQDIAHGRGPEQVVMALGYTGWGAGQLEDEIKGNGWLVVPTDEQIIFDDDLETKWDRSLAKIGVSSATLSAAAGNA